MVFFLLTRTKQAIFYQELPFCHLFLLRTFASIFLSFSIMEMLNVRMGKGKRNNSLKAIKEKSFSPGLLLKIVQSVTTILSVFAITVVATASFYRTDSKKSLYCYCSSRTLLLFQVVLISLVNQTRESWEV